MNLITVADSITVDPSAERQLQLRALALDGLRRMFRPECGLFAFRLRKQDGGLVLEGVSPRYTAIALIGLAGQEPYEAAQVLGRTDIGTVCARLIEAARSVDNLGDAALALWAATALGHDRAEEARVALRALRPVEGPHPTVELAWSLTALALDEESFAGDAALARGMARKLLASFNPAAGMFSHGPRDGRGSLLGGHVACFADLVYPIQALAHYYQRTGDGEAIRAARRCAERMCALQGGAGQWWWHYDCRTGRVIEPYPVYSVHQDAMAPMALFALQKACGADHTPAIRRGLEWLFRPTETSEHLVDRAAEVIWRKVARREPRKLARGLQAVASRIHPSLRVPYLDTVFPPGQVDYECRPYHLGWLLYAWTGDGTELRAA